MDPDQTAPWLNAKILNFRKSKLKTFKNISTLLSMNWKRSNKPKLLLLFLNNQEKVDHSPREFESRILGFIVSANEWIQKIPSEGGRGGGGGGVGWGGGAP